MADAAEKKRTLRSSDGEEFVVEEAVAMESSTIKHMIEDECDGVIPLPNVTSKILARVIEYCRKHVEARGGSGDAADSEPSSRAGEKELKTYDEDFVKVDQATLFDLILVRLPLPPSSFCSTSKHASRLQGLFSDCLDSIFLSI